MKKKNSKKTTVKRVGFDTVRPPVTDLQYVANELDAIATLMWGVAERMEYFGGFKGEMRQHAHELAGAATTVIGWAKGIRTKI